MGTKWARLTMLRDVINLHWNAKVLHNRCLHTYYFGDNYVRMWEKDILWAPDAGEVAINPKGKAQIVIACWCIFMIYINVWIYWTWKPWNYVKNSLLLMHVHEYGNDYMVCIIITAWEIDVNRKLMSCVTLISSYRVIVYSMLVIHVFDSISQCFINTLIEPCGSPCLLMSFQVKVKQWLRVSPMRLESSVRGVQRPPKLDGPC